MSQYRWRPLGRQSPAWNKWTERISALAQADLCPRFHVPRSSAGCGRKNSGIVTDRREIGDAGVSVFDRCDESMSTVVMGQEEE